MTTACAIVLSPGHVYPDHEEAPSRFKYLGGWESKPYASLLQFLEPQPASRGIRERGPPGADAAGLRSRLPPGTWHHRLRANVRHAQLHLRTPSWLPGRHWTARSRVLAGRAQNAFAIVRPPGHHAEPEASMGFCLLNNIAIAARQALIEGIGKALIVDFDVHHGNGTQAVFLEEPRVTFLSTQQENIYPFRSGFIEDAPQARGRIVNVPLPARAGDNAFAQYRR